MTRQVKAPQPQLVFLSVLDTSVASIREEASVVVLRCCPWTSSVSITENLLEIHILVLHPRPAESGTLGMGLSNLNVSRPPGDSGAHLQLAGNVKSIVQSLSLLNCLAFPSEFQGVWRGCHLPAPPEIPGEKSNQSWLFSDHCGSLENRFI